MAIFAPKKTRPHRVTSLRPAPKFAGRVDSMLRDRRIAPRLIVCAVGLLGVLLAVEGWRSPFPHRLGERAPHGISAAVSFKRLNQEETVRARRDAEDLIPFVFQHDPTVLATLPPRLRSHLRDVVEAESYEMLSMTTRRAFGLTAQHTQSVPADRIPDTLHQQFATLKNALSANDGSAGDRIDELVEDFEEFIQPLVRYGVVDPEELERHDISAEDAIAILSPEGRAARTAIASEVRLSEMVRDSGLLGKSWNQFSKLAEIRPMVQQWLLYQSPVTLRYDPLLTGEQRRLAAASVEPIYDRYERGDTLIQPGTRIDNSGLQLLEAEYAAVESQVTIRQQAVRVVTVLVLLVVLTLLFGYYLIRNEQSLVGNIGRLSVYLAAIVVAVGLSRVLSYDPWRAEIVPLMATVMVLAIAYNQVLATLTAFLLTLVVVSSTVSDLGQFVILMSVSATAVAPLRSVASRSILIKIGFMAAIVYFVVSWGNGIVRSQSPSEVWTDATLILQSLRGAGWCLVAGYLVAGSLPFIEQAFDVVTDISLLEMSDISHPLLQELVRRAPGTYNHSITVASIGENAADAIGANGLLVRVGAYFHDIGKMLKPQYFVENIAIGTESRHEHLAPAMSTLIIIGHVKDGVDLARQYNLPERIIDFVEQHHGTTLVEYFYREAAKQAEGQPDHKTDAEESSFRYPGPKPQTPETGVLMLADAVESASRALNEPTPKRLETLVHDITMKRLLDGQFDECSLTLNQIRIIEDSLLKSLIGIYHGRIKYPEQRTA